MSLIAFSYTSQKRDFIEIICIEDVHFFLGCQWQILMYSLRKCLASLNIYPQKYLQ